jgi:hypothetical protein
MPDVREVLGGGAVMVLGTVVGVCLLVTFAPDWFRAIFESESAPAIFHAEPHSVGDPGMIYTDRETGCQYVQVRDGITPRLGRDGKAMCGVKP